jgi:hypothetical protein
VSKRFLVLLFVCLLAAPRVFAQTTFTEPDPSQIKVRIGPLLVDPTISLTNLGVDTNVFNEPDDQSPKRDFTATVVPKADLWMRVGRTGLAGTVGEEIVWYQKYTTERSANTNYKVGWHVPLNRLTFNVGGSYLTTHDRPGFEIDARSRHTEAGGTASAEVRWLARTFFGVQASALKTEFDTTATFDGVNLHDALNRTDTTGGLTIRQELTPLTSVSVVVAREQQRFELSPLRNADSTEVTGKVTFDPAALIKGTASVGYRSFQPVDPLLPAYQGSIASVDLTYTLLGTTRFSVLVARDVQYSYEVEQPYYLQTGVSGSIAQQLYGPFDVVARAGLQQLAYQDRAGAAVAIADRVDHVRTYGGGIGYHAGSRVRIGVNVDQNRRTSGIEARRYSGLVVGTSVTYGF